MPQVIAGQIRARVPGIDHAGLVGRALLGPVTSRAGKKTGRCPVLGSNGQMPSVPEIGKEYR